MLKDVQNKDYLEKPVAVHRNDDLSAIWDFQVVTHPSRNEKSEYDLIIASDSGLVSLV